MKRAIFFAACVLLAAGVAFFIFNRRPAGPSEAFAQSRWGMTPAEVESANGTRLEEGSARHKFFTPAEGQDPARYRVLEQTDVVFLEYESRVSYVFFDDRLTAYHVFLQSSEGVRLDREMRQYLTARFGDGYSMTQEEENPLKMIWQGRELIVNYWFFEEPLALRQKYRAVFGARYLPLDPAKRDK